jgi:hypothetical protein
MSNSDPELGPEPNAAAPNSSSDNVTPITPGSVEPVAPKKLTPEEQMALYEDDLKENDWGHQPC